MAELREDSTSANEKISEPVSEILIPEAINIDYSNKTNNMNLSNEAFTSKNELIKNRRIDPSTAMYYAWQDGSHAVDNIMDKLSHWPFLYQKNLPEISIKNLYKEAVVTKQVGDALLQLFKLRDYKKQWSPDMLKYGIVFPRKYDGHDPAWNLDINYKYTVVSSHGHEFFLEFFRATKGWFDEEEELMISGK